MKSNDTVKLGNWTDEPCYYVDVIDGKRVAYLLGPFKKHEDALNWVDPVRNYTNEQWLESHFYAFGTCKRPNGYVDGKLNSHFSTSGQWDGTGDNLSEC